MSVRVESHDEEIKALFRSGGAVADHVDGVVGAAVAEVAQQLAPRRTGEGADSIDHELVETDSGCASHVSWDAAHFYMRFAETGTVHEPPRPFLVPALDAVIRT